MGTPDAAANYLASRELVTPRRLREFFAPESIAMVGASDNSGWGRFIVASCQTTGFGGPLMAVHPRAKTAFGLPVVPSLRDLPEPADLAFILAPVQAVESVLADMGAAGIKNAVILASGYREVGDDGRTLENAMVSRAIGRRHHRARAELPGVPQRAHAGGALRADPSAAADRRSRGRRPAERRPGQRGARLHPGACHRGERAHLGGQRVP